MRVAPGTKLFLYNYQVKELSGIFEATSNGDMDLEPDAFQGLFPAQVPLMLLDVKPVIQCAYQQLFTLSFQILHIMCIAFVYPHHGLPSVSNRNKKQKICISISTYQT